jgi:hypothetical protein
MNSGIKFSPDTASKAVHRIRAVEPLSVVLMLESFSFWEENMDPALS